MARSNATSLLLLGGAAAVAYSFSRGGMPARGQRDPMPDAMYWETLWDPQGRIKGLIWKSAEGPIYELLFAGSLSMQEWSVYVGGGTKVGTFKTRKAAVDAARRHYYATTPGWGHGAGQRAGFGGGEHISWEQQMYEKRMATPAKKYIYRFKPGRHPGIEQDIGKAISYARSKGLVVEENVEESLRGGPWKKVYTGEVADFRSKGRTARGWGGRSARGRRAWERGPVNIAGRGGVMEVAQGEILQGSGLGIFNKKPRWGMETEIVEGVGWSVTHLESGLSLGSTKLKRDARSMVEEIVAAVPEVGSMSAPELYDHTEVLHPIIRRYRA